ncbi:hypothetical protein Q1695_008598 [Nippostrongylus brasiliensis]|nr:hypothetical protein Q1695_008598 [Nippostrongylus brasiliensis]
MKRSIRDRHPFESPGIVAAYPSFYLTTLEAKMSDLGTWFRSVPIVTRYWFAISVILPLLGRFGLIHPAWMYLDWDLVVYRFHFWRPITALLFYPVSPQTGFHWLLMLYFLYNYSKNLETGVFSGRPADYLYMLMFNWLVCTGICMAAGVYFLLEPMVLSVLYVWCQLNKDTIVSFWFGTTFKAMYLPWILCAFNAVLRGGGMNELLGILVIMQNDAGETVELYVPRKCSSSNRLIGPKDHSSIQIDIVDVDPITGRMVAGKATRYAICGALRRQGESDDALLRLAQRDGIIPKNL